MKLTRSDIRFQLYNVGDILLLRTSECVIPCVPLIQRADVRVAAMVFVSRACFTRDDKLWWATKKTQYGINNVAVSGCLYIATGGDNFIGARIGGREWELGNLRLRL